MGRARQIRRLAARWAQTLGYQGGMEAVEDFANGGPCGDHIPTQRELRASVRGAGWSESAAQAGAAEIDRCPKGHEDAYYWAYDRGAEATVERLCAAEGIAS